MPRMSNSPTANRALNSTAELKRFDATEIRSLTLDEIDFVTGGSKTTGQVSMNPLVITTKIDKTSPISF